MPIEIRRFGVGNRRPDGPPGTIGVTAQIIHADGLGLIAELAFGRNARIEPHTLANARLTYQTPDRAWSIALEATNLFDKFYYLNKFVNAFYVDGQPGKPREVALTVNRRF